MPEAPIHKRYKQRAAGSWGKTEVTLPSGRRVDAISATGIATQAERSIASPRIRHAAEVLQEAVNAGFARKARLSVRQEKLEDAFEIMREVGLGGELTNLSRTKKRYVPKRQKA